MNMSERKVRVRFAPSPTGALHIGGVRTALYNYLFAKQNHGDMIFRIEDTDSQRFVPGAEAYIIEALEWLGIKFDEGVSYGGNYGPYRQSERKDIYRKYVNQLLDAGKAYIAFDTPAELEAKRNEIANFQYDASTRMQTQNSLTMDKEEVDSLIAQGQQYVVRFKIEPAPTRSFSLSPKCPMGVAARIFLVRSVGVPSSLKSSFAFCSLAKKPGAMALTRMPTLEK